MGLITGPWSGIPNLLLTAGLGLIVIIIGAVLADRLGKSYAPFIMVGMMAGLQIMVSFTSSKDCTLTLGGQEFFIIAGSLMYPILACGEDYINEFYGKDIAKSSVTCQFIVRALSTAYLIWLIYLPAPAASAENYTMFAKLMGVVPRVSAVCSSCTYSRGSKTGPALKCCGCGPLSTPPWGWWSTRSCLRCSPSRALRAWR